MKVVQKIILAIAFLGTLAFVFNVPMALAQPEFDLDNSGRGDLPDVMMAVRCYGSYPGHPRWELDYDVDGTFDGEEADIYPDLQIRVDDILYIALNFGNPS